MKDTPRRIARRDGRLPHFATEHEEVHRLVTDAGDAAVADSTRRESAQARHRARILTRIQTREDLRDLFIMRELLDRPVSLRDPPSIG